MNATGLTVGDALLTLLDDAIPAERARKQSLEARGLAVITSSGVLVSLLLGLAALVTKDADFRPPAPAVILLTIAAAAYTAAAMFGIVCNLPGRYFDIDATSLESLATQAEWSRHGDDAARELALARLWLLADWQRMNEIKGRWLMLAGAIDVVGILLTAAAVAVILGSA